MDGVMEAELFFKPEVRGLFAVLAERMADEWPDTRLRTMKSCISFDDPRPYLYVSAARRSMTGGRPGLLLTFGLPEAMQHARFAQVVPVSAKRYTIHMTVREVSEIDDELVGIIAMSRTLMKR